LEEAASTAVGSCCATSLAKLGPDNTTTGRLGPSSCAITSDMRRSVSASSPFVVLTIVADGAMYGAAARITARQPCDGIAETTRSVASNATPSDAVTDTDSGSVTSGR